MHIFTKWDSTKKSIFVAEQIMKNIEDGRFQIGEKLPPEQTLVEEIRVSRTSIREALAALELAGIIERRAGDGTYVRSCLPLSQHQALRVLEESQGALEAIEARSIVEPGIAELACERMGEKDLRSLHSIVQRMHLASGKDNLDEFIEADYDFHGFLARCCKNPILEKTMDQYLHLMRQQLWKYIKTKCFNSPARIEQCICVHEAILTALRRVDKETVRREMQRHFDDIFEALG